MHILAKDVIEVFRYRIAGNHGLPCRQVWSQYRYFTYEATPALVLMRGWLRPRGTKSISHYHKYLNHDYFLDVWSNIHYGYVGLVAGFSKETLLKGASNAQFLDNGTIVGDAPDDVTSIKIGFYLYNKFGESAQALTADDVLAELEKNNFNESRLPHSCEDEVK